MSKRSPIVIVVCFDRGNKLYQRWYSGTLSRWEIPVDEPSINNIISVSVIWHPASLWERCTFGADVAIRTVVTFTSRQSTYYVIERMLGGGAKIMFAVGFHAAIIKFGGLIRLALWLALMLGLVLVS